MQQLSPNKKEEDRNTNKIFFFSPRYSRLKQLQSHEGDNSCRNNIDPCCFCLQNLTDLSRFSSDGTTAAIGALLKPG
jgi:hypothetical protein